MTLEDKINKELDLIEQPMSAQPTAKTFQHVYGSYTSLSYVTDVVLLNGTSGITNVLDCASIYPNPGTVITFINNEMARWEIKLPYKDFEIETNQTITVFYDGGKYYKI